MQARPRFGEIDLAFLSLRMNRAVTIKQKDFLHSLSYRVKGSLTRALLEEKKMESPAFFYTVFLSSLLVSITSYSIYVGFGPPSKSLRDPFEEHED